MRGAQDQCFRIGCVNNGIAVLSLHRAHSYVSVFDSRAGQKRFFSVGEKWQHLGTALLPVKEEKKILDVRIFPVFLALHE